MAYFQKRIWRPASSYIFRKKYYSRFSPSFFLRVIITGFWNINNMIIVYHCHFSIVKFRRRLSCSHQSHIMRELWLSSIWMSSQLITILEKLADFSKKPQVFFCKTQGFSKICFLRLVCLKTCFFGAHYKTYSVPKNQN